MCRSLTRNISSDDDGEFSLSFGAFLTVRIRSQMSSSMISAVQT